MIVFIVSVNFPTRPLDAGSCCRMIKLHNYDNSPGQSIEFWSKWNAPFSEKKSAAEKNLRALCYEIATDSVSSAERGFLWFEIVWMSNSDYNKFWSQDPRLVCHGPMDASLSSNSNPKRRRRSQDARLYFIFFAVSLTAVGTISFTHAFYGIRKCLICNNQITFHFLYQRSVCCRELEI